MKVMKGDLSFDYNPYPGLQTLPTCCLSGLRQASSLPEAPPPPPPPPLSLPPTYQDNISGLFQQRPLFPYLHLPPPPPPPPKDPTPTLLITAALKNLTLKAARHCIVNLILSYRTCPSILRTAQHTPMAEWDARGFQL